MSPKDQDWMSYIDAEVRQVCAARGWRAQIRRKGAVCDKPVKLSILADYEWKLVPPWPTTAVPLPDDTDEGCYYVLSCERDNRTFVLQHDTSRVGVMDFRWELQTLTQIQWLDLQTSGMSDLSAWMQGVHPPPGWLRDHLERLLARFGPNHFWMT